ncbi:MAG: HD domain-containing protein [Syntrophotaleaceae bacterium]
MSPESFQQIVVALTGTYKGLRLYPAQHPTIRTQLDNLMHRLAVHLEQREMLKLGLLEGTLFIDDHLFAVQTPAINALTELLQQFQIEALEFHRGLDQDELLAFLQLLGGSDIDPAELEELLSDRNIEHIRLAGGDSEDEQEPRKVYGRAMTVVNEIFEDVHLGRIPSSKKAKQAVKDMARLTLSDPHALFALSMLKSYDNYTFTHSVNVSVIALSVGRACQIPEEQLRELGLGGLLHDIGKLKIDLAIINKPGRLNEQEFAQIMNHPRLGAEIVNGIAGIPPSASDIVLGHHLHYNRQGYPADAQLHGSPDMVHMAAIADSYDAITTLRSYQRPVTPRQAIAKMQEASGTMLHPEYLQAFIASLGTYPVGSLVRLANNEIGLVIRVGTDNPDEMDLKILFSSDGQRLQEPHCRQLASTDKHLVVAEVDAFIKGINPIDYF